MALPSARAGSDRTYYELNKAQRASRQLIAEYAAKRARRAATDAAECAGRQRAAYERAKRAAVSAAEYAARQRAAHERDTAQRAATNAAENAARQRAAYEHAQRAAVDAAVDAARQRAAGKVRAEQELIASHGAAAMDALRSAVAGVTRPWWRKPSMVGGLDAQAEEEWEDSFDAQINSAFRESFLGVHYIDDTVPAATGAELAEHIMLAARKFAELSLIHI